MPSSFTEAKPTNRRLLIGIAGPQGSGKTVSALRLATGMVEGTGKKIALIDTENFRALQYAGEFAFHHADLSPPFRSHRYAEKIREASESGEYGVIIVDSTSHEHEGIGGLLEWHEEEIQRLTGGVDSKREAMKFTAWIKPKADRNKLTQMMQRAMPHIILCFRAKAKTKISKVEGKKTEVTKTGLSIVGGEDFAYEMNIIAILPQGSRGKPDWNEKESRINDMRGNLRQIFADHPQLNEITGQALRDYAAGVKGYYLRGGKGQTTYSDVEEWRAAATTMLSTLAPAHIGKFLRMNPETAHDEKLSILIKEKKDVKVPEGPKND